MKDKDRYRSCPISKNLLFGQSDWHSAIVILFAYEEGILPWNSILRWGGWGRHTGYIVSFFDTVQCGFFQNVSNDAGVPRMVLQYLPRPHCGLLSSLQHSQILGA
jgi:hypothetical protein